MFGRITAITLTVGALAAPTAALAQSNAGAVAAGVVTGVAIATGAIVPEEQRVPLHEYVVRENRPSYVYSDEVVVGRALPPGGYETYPVPDRYGVPGHHYTVVNGRVVILHPETRRIIHVYE